MFRQTRKTSTSTSTSIEPFAARHANETFLFKEICVEVRRCAYKRSIGVTLQVNGRVHISAPKTTPLRNIRRFLEIHDKWIRDHLRKYEELRKRFPPKRYVEGEQFLFLGEPLGLRFVAGSDAGVRMQKSGRELLCEIPRVLWSNFKPAAGHPELALKLARFYENTGRALLDERVKTFSQRMRLYPTSLSFRSQKTRWGSCSPHGRISLNWRLIVAPLAVVDYVVVHELAHLRHHDHAKEFWQLVGQYCPDYRSLREWLRTNQYEADFLARRSELHPEAIST